MKELLNKFLLDRLDSPATKLLLDNALCIEDSALFDRSTTVLSIAAVDLVSDSLLCLSNTYSWFSNIFAIPSKACSVLHP
jgi:hypothetical protein